MDGLLSDLFISIPLSTLFGEKLSAPPSAEILDWLGVLSDSPMLTRREIWDWSRSSDELLIITGEDPGMTWICELDLGVAEVNESDVWT